MASGSLICSAKIVLDSTVAVCMLVPWSAWELCDLSSIVVRIVVHVLHIPCKAQPPHSAVSTQRV